MQNDENTDRAPKNKKKKWRRKPGTIGDPLPFTGYHADPTNRMLDAIMHNGMHRLPPRTTL